MDNVGKINHDLFTYQYFTEENILYVISSKSYTLFTLSSQVHTSTEDPYQHTTVVHLCWHINGRTS